MARRLGILERAFINLKNSLFVAKQKDVFVGSDKHGNKYFERAGDKSHNVRASRFIQERTDMGHDNPEIPVEWNAWLRGLRKNPPTPEEIEKNYITMMTTKLKAEKLDRKFSGAELPASSTGSAVGEDIKSNLLNTPFPKHDDLEAAPGEFSIKSTKVK